MKSLGKVWDTIGTTGQILLTLFLFYFISLTFGKN